MNVLVVYLKNYFPKGTIKDDYCNKVNIYKTDESKTQLIDKIYNDLQQKLDMFIDYICVVNGETIIINKQTLLEIVITLLDKSLKQNKDIHLPIVNQQGAAFGKYDLFIYHSAVQ